MSDTKTNNMKKNIAKIKEEMYTSYYEGKSKFYSNSYAQHNDYQKMKKEKKKNFGNDLDLDDELNEKERKLREQEDLKRIKKEEEEKISFNSFLGRSKKDIKEEIKEELKKMENNFMNNEFLASENFKPEMLQYIELFDDSLFDEAFMLLEKNTIALKDTIEKNKHIRDFFGFIFDEEFFYQLLEKDKVLPMSVSFVDNIMNKEFLQNMGSKLGNFSNPEIISVMFSALLRNQEIEKASFLVPFFNPDIKEFPKTIKEALSNKNNKSLRFICENLHNIHYNNDELLRLSVNNIPAIKMLVEEFDFNINEMYDGENIISGSVLANNLKTFEFLYTNYKDKINFKLSYLKKKSLSLFDLMEQSPLALDFYKILLNDQDLSKEHFEIIANTILSEEAFMAASLENISDEVLSLVFSHPSFDHERVNLGQKYFIYGVMSKIGSEAGRDNEAKAAKYLKVLNSYLENTSNEDIPATPKYHLLGAAVMVAEETGSKIGQDALASVLKRYPEYINEKNPNGLYCIEQVKEGSPVASLLVNAGSVQIKHKKGLFNLFNSKEIIQSTAYPSRREKEQVTAPVEKNLLENTKTKVNLDFNDLKPLLNNPNIDPIIKVKCENMFLKTNKLLEAMKVNKINLSIDNVHFLNSNFSVYLKKSLSYYLNACEVTSNVLSEDKKEEKLVIARKECLELVDLLDVQLSLISENTFKEIQEAAFRDLKVQKKFLHERFNTTGPESDVSFITDGEVKENQEKLNELIRNSEANNAENDEEKEIELEIGATPVRRFKA